MYTLGINAAFHDCAAALVHDGIVISAAEEERFTHVKHGKRPVPFATWQLPFHAIEYCLREACIALADVDHIAYSFDPWLLLDSEKSDPAISLPLQPSAAAEPAEPGSSPWDPLFLSYVVNAPRQLHGGAPHYLQKRLQPNGGKWRWHFVEHHRAHEASAFLAAPYDETAVLILDSRGERATTTYGHYTGGEYRRLKRIDMPDSLGLLYEDLTRYLGFLHACDEHKVMALASFGQPTELAAFREILQYTGDGGYRVAAPEFEQRFGPARERGGPIEQRHFDIARSAQCALEETVLEMTRWLHALTRAPNLCLAGGVALNCAMNARIAGDGRFERIWVQPAAGDAGTALGAALWIDSVQRGHPPRRWRMDHAFLGPQYDDEQIEKLLRWSKMPYRRAHDVAEEAAALLAQDKIIGWFQGRMEFGPRALGARSILASPIDAGMQVRLNEVKDREDFRPVAPVVLEEEAGAWFDGCGVAPFMTFVYNVAPDKIERIPAVRHVDGTARVQTINRAQHARYYDVLTAFHRLTGVPVLVNTSFNTRGEPIVCTPRDALECYWTSPLDALVIGSFVLEKAYAASAQA